ncbi:MAG TPA: class I SAM-dependent methyltransferase [Fimbriimonadaceae bacterium]|nr:class I SAM-dependent methyltransferase [Fimbriimonadaceae bacterium]
MTSFGPVAPFYDELMQSVPYRMWVGYYLLLLSQQNLRPRKLLDVCCGTGTVAEMLVREGFQVHGFDLSAPMVDEARRKARRRKLDIRYEVADAAEVHMGETYDGAFSFFDSLNNILEPQRLQMAFHRLSEHLRPKGSLIFDLNTAYAFEAKLFDQQQLSERKRLRYKWTGDWDPASRIIHVHMRFWYEGEYYEETHVQRAYEDEEIRHMLAQAGFEEVRAYESYTLNPPRYRSDRVHYTAVRP